MIKNLFALASLVVIVATIICSSKALAGVASILSLITFVIYLCDLFDKEYNCYEVSILDLTSTCCWAFNFIIWLFNANNSSYLK